MKLTRNQISNHESAVKLLEKDILTYEEKLQVYRDWLPAYNNNIGTIASYFTPIELAKDACIQFTGYNIVDLCAGIGMLAFTNYHWCSGNVKITCIERNPEFVKVGKKLLPEANWICADVLDESIYKDFELFDCTISNPPFGRIKSNINNDWLDYKGSEFEYKVIEIGSRISKNGVYIIPQLSSPFTYSFINGFNAQSSSKYEKFELESGIELEANIGIDISIYKNDWVGTSIKCEIVCVTDQKIK